MHGKERGVSLLLVAPWVLLQGAAPPFLILQQPFPRIPNPSDNTFSFIGCLERLLLFVVMVHGSRQLDLRQKKRWSEFHMYCLGAPNSYFFHVEARLYTCARSYSCCTVKPHDMLKCLAKLGVIEVTGRHDLSLNCG